MSTIQKKLDSLQPYVISIRYVQGINVVDAVFKEGWAVPKSDYIEIEKGNNEDEYYMFFSLKEDIGVDELLDYVEHIININIERELKYELLKEKVKELKSLFNKTSLNNLKRLKFKLSDELVSENVSEEDILLTKVEEYKPKDQKEEEIEEVPSDPPKKQQPPKENTDGELKENISSGSSKNFKDIELPPKGEKIEVESFEPVQTECNCGPDDVCPICADEKGF